jgi:hypothetical protein
MKTLQIKWLVDVRTLDGWQYDVLGAFDTQGEAYGEASRSFPGVQAWARTVEILA